MMKYDMDQLLKNALSFKEEPDERLNRKLLDRVQEKEREIMNKRNRYKIPAVAGLSALVISVGSITGYAAWKYLTPEQVAESIEDQGLAAAFQSGDAVTINETRECGDYRVTLLGIVSGKNLSRYLVEDDAGKVRDDCTYAVTAIENADGTPRPDTSADGYGQDPFFVSPLIEGLDPAVYNIASMGGGYSEVVQDGIQYRMIECDNVEKFADRPVHLCVCDGTFYNNEAYRYDTSDGTISRNENYQGVNALFSLPLDEGNADKEGAEEYLKDLEKEWNGEAEVPEGQAEAESQDGERAEIDTQDAGQEEYTDQVSREIQGWQMEDFEENAELVKEMEVAPDAEGNYSYQYEVDDDGFFSEQLLAKELVAERDAQNMAKTHTIMEGTSGKAYIETYTIKEDGTMLLRVFRYGK